MYVYKSNEQNENHIFFWKHFLFFSLDLIPIEYQNVLKHAFYKNRKKRN